MEHQETLNGIGEEDMNPLIEKFEEVYGKKPKEGGLIEQIAGEASPDVISLGGDTVIPTAQRMPGGGINLTGDYIDSGAFISNGFTISSVTNHLLNKKSVTIPSFTEVDKQFGKVLDDLSTNKAVVESIKSDICQSEIGFGVQVRYTVEIVGTYP
jgi:hypothetical protein